MNIVIQCAASKSSQAGCLRDNQNRQVLFVADPSVAPINDSLIYAKPDDIGGASSWREQLSNYNENPRDNPLNLLPAYQLYNNPTYSELVKAVGIARVFILSAGWGLIKASFLTPNYDITFSASAEKYKRRRKSDHYRDFSQLVLSSTEDLIFFGGKDYIPLFQKLSAGYNGARYIPFNLKIKPDAPGCQLIRYETTTRTNWHYECVRAFLAGSFTVSI